MRQLLAFPQANRDELQRAFDNSLSDVSRNMIDRNKRVTAESLNLGRTIVALSMQYTLGGYIDISFLESELQRLSENGIKTVLIAGTTGESSSMIREEHITYVRIASSLAQKYGINVIGGVGAKTTTEQFILASKLFHGNFPVDLGLFQQLPDLRNPMELITSPGVTASLLLPPYYIKTSNENLIRHFTTGLNAGPGIIYSIKSRTGMEIPIEVIEILSKHPNFIGVKECDGSSRVKGLTNMGITVWTGNDDQIVNDVSINGAYGAISVTAGIIPDRVSAIIEGRLQDGSEVYQNNIASNLLFPSGYPNPHLVHNVFSLNRYDGDYPAVFRLPVGPIGNSQQEFALRSMNLLGISGTKYGNNIRLF